MDNRVIYKFVFPFQWVYGCSKANVMAYIPIVVPVDCAQYFAPILSKIEEILSYAAKQQIKIGGPFIFNNEDEENFISHYVEYGKVHLIENPTLPYELICDAEKFNGKSCGSLLMSLPLYVSKNINWEEIPSREPIPICGKEYDLTNQSYTSFWKSIISQFQSIVKPQNEDYLSTLYEITSYEETNRICVIISEENLSSSSTPLFEHLIDIKGTNRVYRYDVGNPDLNFKDHIHVFIKGHVGKGQEVFIICRDGSGHDRFKGSMYHLSNSEVKFLKSIGFSVPENRLIECCGVDDICKAYSLQNIQLLFD